MNCLLASAANRQSAKRAHPCIDVSYAGRISIGKKYRASGVIGAASIAGAANHRIELPMRLTPRPAEASRQKLALAQISYGKAISIQ